MTPTEILNYYETVPAAAKALEFTPAAIYQWRAKKKIPYSSQLIIELRTKGRFKAKAPK